ncbi:hypothetical protein BDV95DRAFT_555910 [Massariosphaeria phaeospora]|uniref:Mid2 domain-containing protein n=1 Tax=Massariosphaeria phaeospora TaxID=100035 RepID=A0A7C8MGL0_9PLEO|nr:hypothetical protein BDV95DRAFT_555910 [Massariosphaeria phaeospora]
MAAIPASRGGTSGAEPRGCARRPAPETLAPLSSKFPFLFNGFVLRLLVRSCSRSLCAFKMLALFFSFAMLFGASRCDPQPPAVTARALLPRADLQTFGWWSIGMNVDVTVYSAWIFDPEVAPITSSAGYWVDYCADQSGYCDIPTSCGGGSLYYSGTRSEDPCPVTQDGNAFVCITDYLYASLSASTPLLSKVGCVNQEARTYFRESPTTAAASGSSTGAASAGNTPISTSSSGSPSASPSASPSPARTPQNIKTAINTGAIVGGAVGGVVGLAALALLAFFLLRRSKRKSASASSGAYAPTAGTEYHPAPTQQTEYYGGQTKEPMYAPGSSPQPQGHAELQGESGYAAPSRSELA